MLFVDSVGGGERCPRFELVTLFGEQFFQRGEQRENVLRPRAVTHQTDPPDFALELAQAGADFDAEPFQQSAADGGVIHSSGDSDRIEHRQLMAFLSGESDADRRESGLERGMVLHGV